MTRILAHITKQFKKIEELMKFPFVRAIIPGTYETAKHSLGMDAKTTWVNKYKTKALSGEKQWEEMQKLLNYRINRIIEMFPGCVTIGNAGRDIVPRQRPGVVFH